MHHSKLENHLQHFFFGNLILLLDLKVHKCSNKTIQYFYSAVKVRFVMRLFSTFTEAGTYHRPNAARVVCTRCLLTSEQRNSQEETKRGAAQFLTENNSK